MNPYPYLHYGLLIGAAGQFCVSMLNLRLVALLGWQSEIARLPRLMREVFQVHIWFITATLLVFAVVTWRFAGELAAGADPAGRWLACGIGAFWLARTVVQLAYYSPENWRGQPGRMVIHGVLLLAYGALAGTYLTAGLR